MKKFLTVLIILICVNVFAADKVTIEADNVDSSDNNLYHALGNVKVFQGEKTMLADEIYYYKDINYLEATGNVRLTDPQETVDCDKLEYDTDRQTGTFYNADGFMEPYNWFKAKLATKTGENAYTLQGAKYTTCSGTNPAWSFSASSAKIDVGGYFSAYNVSGWAKSVPVFYSPYIIYPVKTERESGFLLPKLGVSSTLGAFIQPKYYYNMDVDKDMTFTALIAQKDKPLYSMETRYIPATGSSFYNYIEYTAKDKETPSTDADSDYISKKSGRYYIYNNSTFKISDNLDVKINLESVSDYSYLDDYNDYSQIKSNIDTDKIYKNSIQTDYYNDFSDMTLKYSDNMSYTITSNYEKEHTYLKPSFSAQKDIDMSLLNFRYYVSHDEVKHTDYLYNYSGNTATSEDLSYSRNHIDMMLYKDIPAYIGTLTPYVRMYYTKWYNIESNYDYTKPTKQVIADYAYIKTGDDYVTRMLYTFGYNFSFKEIYKNYANFKHTIYNTITYTETPTLDQSDLFDYTYEDVIDYDRSYSYTLKNTFVAKDWALKIENTQPYTLAQKNDRFSNLVTKVDYNYTDFFTTHLEHEYEYYEKDINFLTWKAGFKLSDITLYGGYTFDKDTSDDQNTTLTGTIKYSQPKYDLSYSRTSSGWNPKFSLKTGSSIDDNFTVTYKSECWQMGVSYTRKTTIDNIAVNTNSKIEHVFLLTLGLRGLGKYSSQIYSTTTTNGDN